MNTSQKRWRIARSASLLIVVAMLLSAVGVAAAPDQLAKAPPSPRVTTPMEFFGYNMGDDYQITPWQTREVPNQGVRKGILDYMYELERTSNRLRVFPDGTSTEGRPMAYVVLAAPETWAQIDKYQAITQMLADPRKVASDEEAMSLALEGKAVYWINAGIHASERTGAETETQLAYELASGRDEWTNEVLDNLILVLEWIDPDGLDLTTDYYYTYLPTTYSYSPPCYNHYVCHDTNRDFVGVELAETRNSVVQRFIWNPVMYTDLHQSRDLLYLGMPADPVNYNYSPIASAEMLGMNGYVITQMIADGYPGIFTYDYADMWNPTYNHMYSVMHNSSGGWWELQGANIATPTTYRGGRNDGHRTWFNPYPYFAPVEIRLIDALNRQKDAVKHSMIYIARNKVDFLYNFYLKGKTNMEKAAGEAPYAFVIPTDGGDNVDVTDLINNFTVWQHIEVDRATADFVADGQQFHAGDYVVRLNQPYGLFAQLLLTPQDWPAEEVVNPYLGGPGGREYDTYAWSQDLLRDVKVVGLNSPLPDVALEPVTDAVPYEGSLSGGPSADYAIEHDANNGWVPALAQLWQNPDMSVSQVDAPFSAAGRDFPAGTFLVHTDGSQASHDALEALVQENGLIGYSIGSDEVPDAVVLNLPHIGLYHTLQDPLMYGWTAIRMDRSSIPYTDLSPTDIKSGNLDGLDVIIIPANSVSEVINGNTSSSRPPELRGGIGAEGAAYLKSFAEAGGVVIFLGDATGVPEAQGWNLGVSSVDEPTVRGSVLRIEVDPTMKVGYGYDQEEATYFYDSYARLLAVDSGSPAQVVASYPTSGPVLLSGYISDEGPMRGNVAMADVPLGDGHVILLASNTLFRGFATGTYMFFWNSIIEGARSG